MLTCSAKVAFDAAKRLMDCGTSCGKLHGYHHTIEATFKSKGDRKNPMIIDFYDIRDILGAWVSKHWDHNTILNEKDKKLGDAIEKVTGQKIYYMPCDPTSENMADYLKSKLCPELFKDQGVDCVRIRLYDNPDSYVESD